MPLALLPRSYHDIRDTSLGTHVCTLYCLYVFKVAHFFLRRSYRDIKKYILERRDALGGSGPERSARDILMADEPTAAAPSKKGFSS